MEDIPTPDPAGQPRARRTVIREHDHAEGPGGEITRSLVFEGITRAERTALLRAWRKIRGELPPALEARMRRRKELGGRNQGSTDVSPEAWEEARTRLRRLYLRRAGGGGLITAMANELFVSKRTIERYIEKGWPL